MEIKPELDQEEVVNYTDSITSIALHKKEFTFSCAYCREEFPNKVIRVKHEENSHADENGKFLEITCDICQEILPSGTHLRRHAIAVHKKRGNYSLVKKEPVCCDECGKTFKVRLMFFTFFRFLV